MLFKRKEKDTVIKVPFNIILEMIAQDLAIESDSAINFSYRGKQYEINALCEVGGMIRYYVNGKVCNNIDDLVMKFRRLYKIYDSTVVNISSWNLSNPIENLILNEYFGGIE